MEEITLMRGPNLSLIPINENEMEKVASYKIGEPIKAKCTRMNKRNYQFFKKWWDLVLFAYDNWEPTENNQFKGQIVQKNKETFRKEVTILAGHYEVVAGCKGVKKVAKSISFGSMKEAEFAQFYSATIDAILQHFLDQYSEDELVNAVLGYA
jgi:hypothetical protein